MILMRTDALDGKYCDIEGGGKMAKYEYGSVGAGWFPIESVSFGFQSRDKMAAATAAKANTQNNGRGRAATPQISAATGAATAGAAGGGAKGEEEPHTLSISRFVDRVTVQLMDFAMQDRKATKADEDALRKVDIHFLHSVHVYGKHSAAEEDQYIYPYLMIALDRVLVKGWSISAQGDDRPTESLELWFDKSAMRYHRTNDGKNWIGAEPKGWDQHDDKAWTPGGDFKYFIKPPT